MEHLFNLAAIGAGVIVLALLAAVAAFAKFFIKAGADEALIRTGSGGRLVRIDRGVFAFPALHQVSRVTLATVRLHVARTGRKDSLVTRDKIRANVISEFYLRVQPDEESVLTAARSLGARGMNVESMHELFEGKVTDALRSVAANQAFNELHAHRKEFADQVAKILEDELARNGFRLESVAIINLDQTPLEDLDPNNVFDAEGARMITEVVQKMAEEKNRIVRDKENEILQRNVEARQRALQLEENQKISEADQHMRVRTYEAQQNAAAMKAEVQKAEETEKATLHKLAQVAHAKIANEQDVKARQIEQNQMLTLQEAERRRLEELAKIETEKAITVADVERSQVLESAQIAKQQSVETAQIAKVKAVEAAEIDKQITIAQKEAEHLRAEALRETADAEKERAHQEVITTRARAEADRQKAVAIIKANEIGEKQRIEASAQAAVAAEQAKGKADAVANQAAGQARATIAEAQARRDAAELEALATITLARAAYERGEREAQIRNMMVLAENGVAVPILASRLMHELIAAAPSIVRELVKPAEKISDLKILQINGSNGGANGSASNGHGAGAFGGLLGGNLGQITKTVLEAGAAYPMFKELLEFAKSPEGGELTERLKHEIARLGGAAVPSGASLPASAVVELEPLTETAPVPAARS